MSSSEDLFESKFSSSNGSTMDELSADDLSSCSVCQQPYDVEKRIPKYLPCFHTFCLVCLRSLSSSTVVVTCPLCTRTHTCNYGVESLESNVHALYLAKLAAKCEGDNKQKQKHLVESWCFNCQSVASLVCYFNTSPKHVVVSLSGMSLKEAEELQQLVNEMPAQKTQAIEKRKLIKAYLGSIMQSVMQVEEWLKDQMFKNDRHLAGLISLSDNILDLSTPPSSLCDSINTTNNNNNNVLKLSTLRESVLKAALQLKESLTEGTRLTDEIEMQKRIRIILHLRTAENNQPIPTFSLFEDGFFANWSPSETNLSTTDRNLMVLSHVVFTVLKRWNILLPVRSRKTSSIGGLFYPTKSLLGEAVTKMPPPGFPHPPGMNPHTVRPANSVHQGLTSTQQAPLVTSGAVAAKKSPPNAENVWGSAPPVLSYSQVLNLPKQVQRSSSLPIDGMRTNTNAGSGQLPLVVFRFDEKNSGKYNLSSKFLGEVYVRLSLKAHAFFIQQLTSYCHKPRELTRKITKASPGMFITLQAENMAMLEAVPAMDSLSTWESSERATDAWDVGINAVLEEGGRVIGWKWIFQLERFKPNNMEVTMLFGKVMDGRDLLQRLSARTKQDRFNLFITMKMA